MDETALNPGWRKLLRSEIESDYMAQLNQFLIARRQKGKDIFPQESDWFRALDLSPPNQTRVVILGQDPYHGEGQAHGLCFSVLPGVPTPPSLKNIYKELHSDLGLQIPPHGFLEHWARQGVLMLNSVLTVEAHHPASHKGRGWERFTDTIVARVNDLPQPVVFLLWGAYAQKKAAVIRDVSDGGRHLVLTAAHPSPLAAHKGFFGCRHFSQCNDFLERHGEAPIDWSLPVLPV